MADIAQKIIDENSQKEGTAVLLTPYKETHKLDEKTVPATDGIADLNTNFSDKFIGWS